MHLVKDKSVHASLYTLILKISDKQGRFVLQNLSVAACDCAVSPNCLLQRNTQQTVGSGVIGITIFAVLMILGKQWILSFKFPIKGLNKHNFYPVLPCYYWGTLGYNQDLVLTSTCGSALRFQIFDVVCKKVKRSWIWKPFFLLASLLLSLTCSCGTVKSLVEVDNVLEDALLPSNIEKPGTDCVVICD